MKAILSGFLNGLSLVVHRHACEKRSMFTGGLLSFQDEYSCMILLLNIQYNHFILFMRNLSYIVKAL